jgi:Protein of unknown function (DUF1499)
MIRSQSTYEPLALWSSRFGLFAAALLTLTLVLHRFAVMTTPVASTLAVGALMLAALAILIGLIAALSIWIRGRDGAARTAVGMIAGGLLWLWPLAFVQSFLSLPRINDITTDMADPPRFGILAKVRGDAANSTNYPGERFSREQAVAYPDLRTFVVDRPVDQVFDLAVLAARGRKGLGWKVLVEEPPSLRPAKAGLIEATERTLILGFVDDIVIRISGSDTEARVDIRSASRFGRHDLGANAARIRRFMRELQTRLEATAPGSAIARGNRIPGVPTKAGVAQVKRPLGRLPETKAGKAGSNPAPQDARRAPGQKAPRRE